MDRTTKITKRLVYDLEDHGIDPKLWQLALEFDGPFEDHLLALEVHSVLAGRFGREHEDCESCGGALDEARERWPAEGGGNPSPIDWATADEEVDPLAS